MITPSYLKTGDRAVIISTARKINKERIDHAQEVFESWGLQVKTGAHLFYEDRQFAGDDDARAADLQAALDDYEVRAVFCARGGYGTIRILDQIDFTAFNRSPKWIVGYSDVTVLHCHLQQVVQTESLHASMPVNFEENSERSLQLMRNCLWGEPLSYEIAPVPLNRPGTATGVVVGGNLSILYSLNGSPTFPDTEKKILFIEDLDEYLYHIDRMMMNLKRSGALSGLAGLVVGEMSDMKDNEIPFGKTAAEIISESVSGYDFPVCFGFPAGHDRDNCPLITGRPADLEVSPEGVSLRFSS